MWCWRRALWITWNSTKMNKEVLEHIKLDITRGKKWQNWRCPTSGTSWEGKVLRTTMLGKIESSRKREKQNMSWSDSIKEATGTSLELTAQGCWGRHRVDITRSEWWQGWEPTQPACNTEAAWMLKSLSLQCLEFFGFDKNRSSFANFAFINICRAVEICMDCCP